MCVDLVHLLTSTLRVVRICVREVGKPDTGKFHSSYIGMNVCGSAYENVCVCYFVVYLRCFCFKQFFSNMQPLISSFFHLKYGGRKREGKREKEGGKNMANQKHIKT